MKPRIHRRTFELLLIAAFFLSIGSVIFYIVWLMPQIKLIETILWILISIVSIYYLKRLNNFSKFTESLRRNWFILPFIIFSGLSILWSVYWEISLFRYLTLLSMVLTAGFIGIEYDLREIVDRLAVFGICILLLSAIVILFFPHIGIMNYYTIQGAWKGIFWHKNHMGMMTSFFNILFLIKLVDSALSKERSVYLWIVCYIVSLFFLYQTDSVGAFMTTVFVYGVVFTSFILLKFREKIRKSHYLLFTILLILVGLILFVNLDRFFGIFNRNTTLTGRIPMWTYVFNTYVDKQPMLGYGFNAFWYIKDHRVAIQHAAGYPDQIVIADNGFIDLIVNTGYAGIALFLLFYIGGWWVSLKYAGNARDIIGFFPAILMSFVLIANISWSLLFENEGFLMLAMLSVLFCASSRNSLP